MILFKRVSSGFRHVEPREWVLMTLETLGVLAGILLAFWLNEWGAQRSEAGKHHEMMERLLEENETDISVLRDMRDVLRGMLVKEQAFATRLSQGQCPPNSDFEAVSSLTMMPSLTAPHAVHDELMAAGGLSSIERKDVRESIAQFYGDMEWVQRQIDRFRQAGVKPVEESDARIKIGFDPRAEDPQVETYDGTALCRDQSFRNRVAVAARDHTVYVSYFDVTVQSAISMCVRVADSLGTTCETKHGGPLKGEDAAWRNKAVAQMHKELTSAS